MALEPESGIWYAICWIVLLTRLISRRLLLASWKDLNMDDYLICLAMVTMTTLMIAMHIVVRSSSNLLAPDEDVSSFSQREIDQRIYGSKIVLVVEQMQICTIWLVKSCLLLMYKRMTALLPQHKLVLAVSGYVALAFCIMEILYFGVWCRPFNQYWAVPPSNPQCSAATNHLITNAVLNISSDLMIIVIPMPLLFKVRLPTKNKAVLIALFLIGTFNILAAVLNKYYSFSHPFGLEWPEWYMRESFTAFLCANLPLTYPLVQRIFKLKNWSHNSTYAGRYPSHRTPRSGLRSDQRSGMGLASGLGHGGISKTVSVKVTNSQSGPELQRSESEELIYGPPTSRVFEERTFNGRGANARGVEMGPVSPASAKDGSFTTLGSVKSFEAAHVITH